MEWRYLKTLFNRCEHVCTGSTPYETSSHPMEDTTPDNCYITLNPLVDGSTRADKNVSKLRNFLVEFDDMELDAQLEYVKEANMPFTTCVFSGNKSYHFVLSLAEPAETKAEYDRLVRWLYAAVPEADPSCKNPSRFTRLGGGVHKNGSLQRVEETRERITKETLLSWLAARCDEPADVTKSCKQMGSEDYFRVQASGYRAKMHRATLDFCKSGGRKGFRHKNVFIAACNLRDCYYTLEEAKYLLLKRLGEIYTKLGREDEIDLKERAIEDAYLQAPRTQTRS